MLGLSWHSTSACHAALLRGVPVALAQSIASWDDSVLNSWEKFSSSAASVSSRQGGAADDMGKITPEEEDESSDPEHDQERGEAEAGPSSSTLQTGRADTFIEDEDEEEEEVVFQEHDPDSGEVAAVSTQANKDNPSSTNQDPLDSTGDYQESGSGVVPEKSSVSTLEAEEKEMAELEQLLHPPTSSQEVNPQEGEEMDAPLDLDEGAFEEDELQEECGEEDGAHAEEENLSGYSTDGYLYAQPGDVLDDRFVLVQHIGSGQSSTVWLAKQEEPQAAPSSPGGGKAVHTTGKKLAKTPFDPYVAIKIFRCEEGLLTAMKYEQKLSQYVQRQFDLKVAAAEEGQSAASSKKPGGSKKPAAAAKSAPPRINKFLGSCRFLDSFVVRGDYGDHACAVFEVLGPPLDDLLKTYGYTGIPDPKLLRSILKSCLEGLQLLDDHHVVHTDLKPENLVLSTPSDEVMQLMGIDPAEHAEAQFAAAAKEAAAAAASGETVDVDDPADLKVKIVDFGLSYVIPTAMRPRQVGTDEKELLYIGNYQRGITIQTREYRAPEIILGSDFGPKADVWSFGCLAFELVTGAFLFDPKDNPRTNEEEDLMDVEHLQEMSGFLGTVPLALLQEPSSSATTTSTKKGTGSSPNLRATAVKGSAASTGALCGVHTENYYDCSTGEMCLTIRRPGEKKSGSKKSTALPDEEEMFGEEREEEDEEEEDEEEDEDYHYASPHVGSVELVEEKILDAFSDDQEETDEFMHFLKACIAWDPNKRMSPFQLLQHPWMTRDVSEE